MTPEEFRIAAQEAFGPGRGWQTRAAEGLKTTGASVTRWLQGVPVPGPVEVALSLLLEKQRRKKR